MSNVSRHGGTETRPRASAAFFRPSPGGRLSPPWAMRKEAAWLGFAYVSVFSMFLGFFAWYHGLALGGVAKVSQLQLLQPFLTAGFSAWLLGESVDLFTLVAASLVAISIMFSRRAAVMSRPSPLPDSKA